MDFEGAARRLLADAERLVPLWLPGGQRRGNEYVCAGLKGGAGESLSVNLRSGVWKDFAESGVGGKDLISLYASVHNLSQGAALKELDPEAARINGAVRDTDPPKDAGAKSGDTPLISPPHVEFEARFFRHPRHGTPVAFWLYYDAEGAPLFVVARYQTDTGKVVLPWRWDGSTWVNKSAPKPRPLYGLDRLAEFPDAPILLVEGEKAADAAFRFFPRRPCMTWCGGAAAFTYADWEPLRGKQVTIWPDADEAGRNAAVKIAEILLRLEARPTVILTDDLPESWDLADAEAEGRSAVWVVNYARAHCRTIELPKPQPPHPRPGNVAKQHKSAEPPRKAPERLKDSAASGATVTDSAPRAGSLYHRWQEMRLALNGNGRPYCNESNVARIVIALEMDVWWDSFARRVMVGDKEWSDELGAQLLDMCQQELDMGQMRLATIHEGVQMCAFMRKRNPPRDWLLRLKWDGTYRLKDLMPVGFGTLSTAYAQAVGRCFLVGMVARVLDPGCKVDAMPILEGAQGAGKSTALAVLGGNYYAEVHESMQSKDFYISITGKMLCQLSELSSLRRADLERVKGVISTAVDRYRGPYMKVAADIPRTCVFAGTTNQDDWNTDETGARRFWPLRVGQVNLEWIQEQREQLFAEAVYRYQDGEPWWNVPEEEAKVQRTARLEGDPWEEIIAGYVDASTEVSITYILRSLLNLEPNQITPQSQKRVSRILTMRGFRKTVKREGARTVKKWVRS